MTADSNLPFRAPFPPAPLGVLLALLLASGCALDRPQVDAEATIAESLALPGAVVFRTEPVALDAVPPAADTLPFDDAVRRAVEASPELQAALARVRAAEAEADLAGALPNPVLSLVFRFPEGGGKADVEAGLAADLLAMLQRPRRASAAGHRLEAEAAAALSAALDVVAEVEELYVRAQGLEELAPLLASRQAVLERLHEVAETRLEVGEGSRADVAALDAQRTELAVETSRRLRELRAARLALTRRIGEPSGAAAWQLDAWRAPPDVPTAESVWIEVALRARPEVLALEWEIRARGDDAALARWSMLDGASVGVEAERDGGWSIGPAVAVPLPVFDTGAPREQRANAVELEARQRLVTVQRAVIEEVRTALAAVSGSRAELERVVGELVPLQEQRRAAVEDAYRVGEVDVTAVLFAEQALQETHGLRVGLERELSDALVRLERSVGGRAVLDANVTVARGNP